MEIISRTRLFLLMVLVTISLTGCGGGGATMEAQTTTTGQQLIDLDKAYKDGIITEQEYEKKKKQILSN
jgi:uncharacterized lipoprotein YehR (DUF1307 family)